MSDDDAPPPIGLHYPSPTGPAKIRAGQHITEPASSDPAEWNPPDDLYRLIEAAENLRRLAWHWRADPAWRHLKLRLEAYEVYLASMDAGPIQTFMLLRVRELLGPAHLVKRAVRFC